MKLLQDLSAKICQTLDPILPKNVRCVIVLVDTDLQDVSAVSDMSDKETVILLEEAIEVMKNPEVSSDLVMADNDKILN